MLMDKFKLEQHYAFNPYWSCYELQAFRLKMMINLCP